MTFLAVNDLTLFVDIDADKAQAMIDDAEATAVLAAPCLAHPDDLTPTQLKAIKALLRGALLRWNEAGTGAYTTENEAVGGWSRGVTYDNRQQRRSMFWPSEITQLQSICGGTGAGGAYSIDTTPLGAGYGQHLDTCSLRYGGDCSCGLVLLGYL